MSSDSSSTVSFSVSKVSGIGSREIERVDGWGKVAVVFMVGSSLRHIFHYGEIRGYFLGSRPVCLVVSLESS